jgi:hypothetical protein
VRQEQQQQQQETHQRTVMEREASCSSVENMTQDPVVPPEQLGMPGRLNVPLAPTADSTAAQQPLSVHFSTAVHGVPHSVHVSLPPSPAAEPYPEALPLLNSMHAAVRSGSMNSTEAAQHLVGLLKHREAQQGRMQSLLAAGKAPPGFSASPGAASSATASPPPGLGPTPLSLSQAAATSNGSCLTPQDAPVNPTPTIGRYQPIGKPIGPPGGTPLQHALQQQQQQQQQLLQDGQQQRGYSPLGLGSYSMWSGLPGISLSQGTSAGGAYSPLAASLWHAGTSSGLGAGPPGGFPGLEPLLHAGYAPPPGSSAPTASRAPPPGFGGPQHAPGGLLDMKLGAGGYAPLRSGGYNPLNPFSAMSGVGYRPPL